MQSTSSHAVLGCLRDEVCVPTCTCVCRRRDGERDTHNAETVFKETVAVHFPNMVKTKAYRSKLFNKPKIKQKTRPKHLTVKLLKILP